MSASLRGAIAIQILYTKDYLPSESLDILQKIKHLSKDEILQNNEFMDIPRKAILAIFYNVDDSIKRAFVCKNKPEMIESGNPQECLVYTITPPKTLEEWEIPMQAERILSFLQQTMDLEEVPPWSVKTFGMTH